MNFDSPLPAFDGIPWSRTFISLAGDLPEMCVEFVHQILICDKIMTSAQRGKTTVERFCSTVEK